MCVHYACKDPPILHEDPEEVYMSYPGPPARFSLNFTGNPKPNVSWYQVLPSGAEVHILESGPTSRFVNLPLVDVFSAYT